MNRPIKFRAWDKQSKEWFLNSVSLRQIYCFMPPKEEWLVGLEWSESTGLHDKNGKEIYEGDIFQDDEDGSCEYVEWDKEFGGWSTQAWYSVGEFAQNAERLEVIGNIYENPELITLSPRAAR